MNEQKLLQLKKQIEISKTEIAELTGQKKQLLKELETVWKCSTPAEAEAKIQEYQEKIDSLSKQIEIGINSLQNEYEIT